MRIIFFIGFILLSLASVSYCEDTMNPVFERIDDLVTRVESGISLNSYAESVAQLKIEYKKAQSQANDANYDNPLLSSRMKPVFTILDDYARVWRIQETEGYRYLSYDKYILSTYPMANNCVESSKYYTRYPISCVKSAILDQLYPILDKAKSAHINGW